jgi:Flp pilus assembly protein TadD
VTRFVISELDRLVERAYHLHHAGRTEDAAALAWQVLAWDPRNPHSLSLLAEQAVQRHDHAAAIGYATAALEQEPNAAPAWSHLSQALWLAGRLTEALAPARQAVAIQPTNPLLRINLGQICVWLGLTAEAEAAARSVLDQAWHPAVMHARAQGVIGDALTVQGNFAAAHEALEQAIALAPDYEPLHMAYGLSLLRLGRLREGWAAYARRERIGFFFPGQSAGLPGQRWTGQALGRRTILLTDEQGFGDAIQFARFVPALLRAGASRVVLVTLPPLVALFQASLPGVEVVTQPPVDFVPDYHCLTADLAGAWGVTLDTLPAAVPYLRPPAAELTAPPALPQGEGPSVGLVWAGNPHHPGDHLRSVPAAALLRLADLPGIRFVSLQQSVRADDHAALAARPHVARLGETMANFAQTAALVARLDLVITVDTAVAHLAGALAKPVWLLVGLAPDWRWLIDRADSPWYPTMRLFRAGPDGWAPVIAAAADALRAFARRA